MARNFEAVQVDGVTFEITPLGAVQGRRLFVKILQALGPALTDVAKLADTQAAAGGDKSAMGLALLGNLCKQLDPDLVDELCSAFAAHCTVELPGPNGTRRPKLQAEFGDYFAGRYSHMTRWFVECVRINFADFFVDGSLMSDLRGLSGASATQTKSG